MRVRLADQRHDGVVVHEHGVRAPEQPHRLLGVEADADGRNERARPKLHRPEMLPALRPAQQRAHLAGAFEQPPAPRPIVGRLVLSGVMQGNETAARARDPRASLLQESLHIAIILPARPSASGRPAARFTVPYVPADASSATGKERSRPATGTPPRHSSSVKTFRQLPGGSAIRVSCQSPSSDSGQRGATDTIGSPRRKAITCSRRAPAASSGRYSPAANAVWYSRRMRRP